MLHQRFSEEEIHGEKGEVSMRVALVGDYPVDPNVFIGGPQAILSYLLGALGQITDLELHVVTANKAVDNSYTSQRNGVTFHYLPFPTVTLLAFSSVQRSIHRVLHHIKPDLVHGQDAFILGCIALSAGYPTVLTPHSVHSTDIRFGSRWIDRLNVRLQHMVARRYFVSRVRHIVSVSPYIRSNYEPYVDATFHDINYPVADRFFGLDPDYEIPNQVLFVGLLKARKRPDLALEALALARQKVPELNLQFAGAAEEPGLEAKLRDLIVKNDLGGNVKFLGQLTEAKLLEAYQQMSILVLTSELETSPMAVEQAMAAGKPVVATAAGGVPFLVDHGRTGLVVELNKAEQIAQALVTLARDPELRRRIGQAARDDALSRSASDIVARKTYDMYRVILECS